MRKAKVGVEPVKKTWKFPDLIPDGVPADMDDFRAIERQVLFQRGISDRKIAQQFLAGEYSEPVDPYLLKQMDLAVERVSTAIDQHEPIVIYGDYDADGVSSSSLLYTGIRAMGGEVSVYFPDRFNEGYGLNSNAVESLAREGCSLLITVDCGVRALQEAIRARELGIDLVITDHHIPGSRLPDAYALINPRQPGDQYPFKSMAGVGVAHKLLQALRGTRGAADDERDLEYVAIGTVADIVPLIGENRVLVRRGLELLNQTESIGLKSLIDVAGYRRGSLNSSSIGFGLGPRINAAGRLKSAKLAFDLLVSDDEIHASVVAEQLDRINRERQELTRSVVERAFAKYERSQKHGDLIFEFDETYHEGVIGLAASKLTESFYRPTIVGHLQDEVITASARSIPGFHITRALEQSSDLMERFGGHAAAAGLRIHRKNVNELKERLEVVFEEEMVDRVLQPILEIDGVTTFKQLDDRMMRFHDKLAPFGADNQRPVLVSRHVRVLKKRTVGSDGQHLKLTLEQEGCPFDAIAFRMGDRMSGLTPEIDVAYRLERNDYLGYVTLQLNVADIRPASE